MKYQVQFKNPHTGKWEPARSPMTKVSTFPTVQKANAAMSYMLRSGHELRVKQLRETK